MLCSWGVHWPGVDPIPRGADLANEHGWLPKADSERLDPALRRRLEIWFDKAYRDDNLFLTLARRPAVLDLFLGWVSFAYAGETALDPRLIELCRVRMAARNRCVH
jgi:hypothetical protein